MIKPFAYFGGKHFLLKRLLPLIPPHKCFVEVFGGGASLLFGHPKSKVEVYNDLDSALVDFFRVLQSPEESAELIEKLKLTPYSRELYDEYKENWRAEPNRVERVGKWYLVMTFGVDRGFTSTVNHASGHKNRVDRLPKTINRFRDVQVEHNTWDRVSIHTTAGRRSFTLILRMFMNHAEVADTHMR